MKLADSKIKVSQNLQVIRFVAALAVIFHHSFPLSEGFSDHEWLTRATGGQITAGLAAVGIFFLVSGYFVTGSAAKCRSAVQFFQKRLRRLIPALFFVTVVTILVCSLFSSLSALDYFRNPLTWRYLLNSIFIPVHNLPGVFEKNVYLPTVNGALWTLPVEFGCYVFCYLVKKLFTFEKRRFAFSGILMLIGIAGMMVLGGRLPLLKAVIMPFAFFCIGMCAWVYRDLIVLDWRGFAAAWVLLVLSVAVGAGKAGLLVSLSYIVLYITFNTHQVSAKIAYPGSFAYGIYLCAFPVQQMIVHCFGGRMDPYVNFAISVPIAVLAGAITYECIEKRV